ncbi:MAG: phosphoenolpyruvate--protein phosphotransferase [Emergencia sp.]
MLRGIPVSEGIGIGRAYVIKNTKLSYEKRQVVDTEREKDRFHDAVTAFCRETEEMAQRMEQSSAVHEAEIIRGHVIMISDPFMLSQIDEKIDGSMCAEAACEEVLNMFKDMFMATEDELTMQRAADIDDIRTRMLSILTGTELKSLSDLPAESIIVVEELTPSMTARLDKANVCGIVTEKGGKTSHSAILARALGIPAVLSVPGVVSELVDELNVIIDGTEGIVIPDPDNEELAGYREKLDSLAKEKALLAGYADQKTVTGDGIEKDLYCNVGNIGDAVSAVENSGEGIGLFRTEFLFMGRDSEPDEELQFESYKKAVQLFENGTVIIRTLDVGGDKAIPYLGMKEEDNPFLGFRAVRYCLENEELFRTQLRAAVRASAFGSLAIMVPLVTEAEEIRRVRKLVEEIKIDLDAEGISYDKNLKIGAMIETPAASLIADILAEECDFFSIGTNDLTQYTMAADRGNPQVSNLNSYLQPAVLRSIRHIIECGVNAGIPVGMCGEAAADPMMTPLLISFGLDEFSVSPGSVLRTRYNISRWSKEEADSIAGEVMKYKTSGEIEDYLRKAISN